MAWWLAYEELYGDMDKEYPIMTKKEDESGMITFGKNDQSFWDDDGFSVTGNPYGAGPDTLNITGSRLPGAMGEDHIRIDPPNHYPPVDDKGHSANTYLPPYYSGNWREVYSTKPPVNLESSSSRKYKEDESINDLKDYVASTYSGHYTSKNNNVQTLDLIQSVGDAESFCRSNAIKYLSRYDKKGQAKRDILKAMHYCLLLYYFSGQTNEDLTSHGYETF